MEKEITITEALAELHVLDKRIATKRPLVPEHLLRNAGVKDPLGGEDGGQAGWSM